MEKIMLRNLLLGGLAAAALCGAAWAADVPGAKVTVTLDKVQSDKGSLMVSLCSDPARFMRACPGYGGKAPAAEGSVSVVRPNVPPATYAMLAYHDENGNGVPDIPPEGYGYGNNTTYPPSFAAASIKVD